MDEHGPYIDAHGADTGLVIRATCVRLYASGPAIHANPAHITSGVKSVHIGPDDGYLWVVHDGGPPVVAILCSPDETLTGRGILAGASGGTSHSRVRFTEMTPTGPAPLDLRVPSDYEKVAGNYSNLWYAVVQIGERTQGRASRVDHLAAHVGELEARIALLEQGTPAPLLSQIGALADAVHARLIARQAGPL